MKIKLTSVMVDDQEKALQFYTRVLGFVKKKDQAVGKFKWLTVTSRENSDVELLLEPNEFPAAKEYQAALRYGVISEGHARSLLAINDEPTVQKILFVHIVKDNWSVRKAELFVKSHKESKGQAKVRSVKMQDTNKYTERLEKKLSRTVRIQRTAKGGKLTISFSGDKDLELLLAIF